MKRGITYIYEGEVIDDRDWYSNNQNFYIGDDRIESIFWNLKGKNIRVTIEEID